MLLRIRFHGRGGQGGKTASRILGSAAFDEGLNVQDSPVYGAERRGAPVTAFTRISDGEILERGFIFDPDVVIVMDETLLEDPAANPLSGLREGGILFVNSSRKPDELNVNLDGMKVVTLNITDMALELLGKPILSTASAAVAAKLISVVSPDAVTSAVWGELGEDGLSPEVIQSNVALAGKAFSLVPSFKPTTKENYSPGTVVPIGVISGMEGSEDILLVGNSALRKTGDWRIYTPTIDYEKCTNCMICYAYCPESAMVIETDGRPVIDMENCKGCLICYRECPTKAISITREVRAL